MHDKSTFSSLIKEIQRDIDDFSDMYRENIQEAICNALSLIQNEKFYFTDAQQQEFLTIPKEGFYKAENVLALAAEKIWCRISCKESRTEIRLKPMDNYGPVWQDKIKKTFGCPYYYQLNYSKGSSSGDYNQPNIDKLAYEEKPNIFSLELYPVPDKRYTIVLSNLYQRPENLFAYEGIVWLREGYALLRAKARYLFYRDTLQDSELALLAAKDYEENYLQLKAITYHKKSSHRVKAMSF